MTSGVVWGLVALFLAMLTIIVYFAIFTFLFGVIIWALSIPIRAIMKIISFSYGRID